MRSETIKKPLRQLEKERWNGVTLSIVEGSLPEFCHPEPVEGSLPGCHPEHSRRISVDVEYEEAAKGGLEGCHPRKFE